MVEVVEVALSAGEVEVATIEVASVVVAMIVFCCIAVIFDVSHHGYRLRTRKHSLTKFLS